MLKITRFVISEIKNFYQSYDCHKSYDLFPASSTLTLDAGKCFEETKFFRVLSFFLQTQVVELIEETDRRIDVLCRPLYQLS